MPQAACIQIISEPAVEVYLDDFSMGIVQDDGFLNLKDIKPGRYALKLVRQNLSMQETIVVTDKNERILYFDLDNDLFEDRSPVHRSSKKALLDYDNERVAYGTYTDQRDGTQYKTIRNGNTTWMAENLRFRVPGNSFVYPRDPIHERVYGRLYSWQGAVHACPEGWQLPTDKDWYALELKLGIADILLPTRGWRKCVQTASFKSDIGWLAASASKDTLGFAAFPGGFRDEEGFFFNEGYFAYFWTATDTDATDAWYRVLTSDIPHVGRFSYSKKYAFSIRCVRKNKQIIPGN